MEQITKDSESTWASPPLNQHLETVGIGEVFLLPPPANTLYSTKIPNELLPLIEETWEIIGEIKQSPDDFIVREIGGFKQHGTIKKEGRVADIKETEPKCLIDDDVSSTHSKLPENSNKDVSNLGPLEGPSEVKEIVTRRNEIKCFHNTKKKGVDNQFAENEKKQLTNKIINVSTSLEALIKIIQNCISTSCIEDDNDFIISSIQSLNDTAMLDIKNYEDGEYKKTMDYGKHVTIMIPPIEDDKILVCNGTLEESKNNSNRKLFHQSLKNAFPLLRSSTLTKEESQVQSTNRLNHNVLKEKLVVNEKYGKDDLRWIKIEKDITFYDIIKYLSVPEEDLLSLYKFYKNASSNTSSETMLRLDPFLKRENRKIVHHFISKANRSFITGTRHDVPYFLNDGEISKTTAISVHWSRKRRKGDNSNRKETRQKMTTTNTLCVLKKYQLEHLTAINNLVSALRCTQSDIGLAGIKDMCAVTYQFCTIRNLQPHQVCKAVDSLRKKGIEIGNCESVDWLLNQGDLIGNSFKIIIRNLTMVKRQIRLTQNNQDSNDKKEIMEETMIPLKLEHVAAMVKRVRDSGYINFFGEQRTGSAGPSSLVGVRTIDIGRAMLRNDFNLAINLLMTGRNKDKKGQYIERLEIREARQIFITSRGDPQLTLNKIPRGNGMARERVVLKGLKRYGKDNPLSAFRCLNYNIRMFWINSFQSYIWNRIVTERIKRFGTKPVSGDLYCENNELANEKNVKFVTIDLLPKIKFDQIVLPLPGHNILYPSNSIGKLYRDILKCEGVEFSKSSVPEATAKGSYRKIVAHPERMRWYPIQSHNTQSIGVEFSLGSGSYATMLLRELMVSTFSR